ncbi:DUF2207 domain-containing protein [Nocardiopsis kunsanensis]|uniref:DUF2207 domain-containing protein n=1 Tax=Nocardiopsis kunsanensis TaxID=141693 RepID=UPI001873A405|nr:DUF2207 domain-containing protein [Nocardiopsis kunsanensis]
MNEERESGQQVLSVHLRPRKQLVGDLRHPTKYEPENQYPPRTLHRAAAVIAATSVTAVSLIPAAGADTTDREITSFEVSVILIEDGAEEDSISVTEQLTYDFGAEDGAPMERWLPHSGTVDGGPERDFGLQDVEVTEANGVRYEIDEGDDATTVRMGEESGNDFEGEQSFEISYTYNGLLEDVGSVRPRLALDVVGEEWEIPVRDVSVSVSTSRLGQVHRVTCVSGPPGPTEECDPGQSDDATQESRVVQDEVAPREAMSIEVEFSRSVLDATSGASGDPSIPRFDHPARGTETSEASDTSSERSVYPVLMFLFITGVIIFAFIMLARGSQAQGGRWGRGGAAGDSSEFGSGSSSGGGDGGGGGGFSAGDGGGGGGGS